MGFNLHEVRITNYSLHLGLQRDKTLFTELQFSCYSARQASATRTVFTEKPCQRSAAVQSATWWLFSAPKHQWKMSVHNIITEQFNKLFHILTTRWQSKAHDIYIKDHGGTPIRTPFVEVKNISYHRTSKTRTLKDLILLVDEYQFLVFVTLLRTLPSSGSHPGLCRTHGKRCPPLYQLGGPRKPIMQTKMKKLDWLEHQLAAQRPSF
jgi:hypothetical protein